MPNVAYDFSGQAALVTGAASGIGMPTAKAFAQPGAAVALADVNESSPAVSFVLGVALPVDGCFVAY
jgi:NAD(P)-dependent dehydrogenase (short-subunit alcohol dehydrogenase family)